MSGDSPLAWPNMTSRQAQKSPPSVRPRSARWNACECALTKPGRERREVNGGHCHASAERAEPPIGTSHFGPVRKPAQLWATRVDFDTLSSPTGAHFGD